MPHLCQLLFVITELSSFKHFTASHSDLVRFCLVLFCHDCLGNFITALINSLRASLRLSMGVKSDLFLTKAVS